jgi:hypothetical protein
MFQFGAGQFGQAERPANTGDAFVTRQTLTITQGVVTATGANNVGIGGSSGKIDHRHLRYVGPEFGPRDRVRHRPVIAGEAIVRSNRLYLFQRDVTISAGAVGVANTPRSKMRPGKVWAEGCRPITVTRRQTLYIPTNAGEQETEEILALLLLMDDGPTREREVTTIEGV